MVPGFPTFVIDSLLWILILPDMLINFALINITDRKNEGTNTIDGNWQADEGRRYRDNVRIYF